MVFTVESYCRYILSVHTPAHVISLDHLARVMSIGVSTVNVLSLFLSFLLVGSKPCSPTQNSAKELMKVTGHIFESRYRKDAQSHNLCLG